MPFSHKNIRLNQLRYRRQSSYFVTLCCAGRLPVFANPGNATRLIELLGERSAVYRFAIHAYCVMPDHFHGLFAGLEPISDLLAFVKNLKDVSSQHYNKTHSRALWQKKFYDHILRERDNAAGVAGYIWMNPVRKGLCKDPREYPYSGSFTSDWKKTILPGESWVPDWKAKNKAPP